MIRIIDTKVNLEFPLGHHLHCLIAQIPNRLRRGEGGFVVTNPDEKWGQIRSILDLVSTG